LTIKESIHVKFKKSDVFVKNVVEINFLSEDREKITLKDSPIQEKPKDDQDGEEVEVEPTQPLLKDWRLLRIILRTSS